MPLLQGCPKDSLASLEGAQNTRKAVVMCVRYRFSELSKIVLTDSYPTELLQVFFPMEPKSLGLYQAEDLSAPFPFWL